MNQVFRHEMHLLDAIGGPVHLTLREVLGALTHRNGLMFLAIAFAALLFTDPPGLLDRMAVPLAAMVWIVAIPIYIAFYFCILLVYGLVQMRVPSFPAFLPLVSILALLPAIYLAEALAYGLSGIPDPILFDRIIFDYLSAQSFELVFIRFVLPLIKPASTDDRSGGHVLTLGATRIAVGRVHHMSAQEHYVRITHEKGSELHRARLSDLIAQTGPCDGCQPHRSWWVARKAGPRLSRDRGRHVLTLDDGTRVPVARARLTDVRAWLSASPAPKGRG